MTGAPRTQSGRNTESGFTLIELLVSLTILAVILGLLGSGLRVLAHNADRNSERIQIMDMIARASDILKRDAAGLQRLPIVVARKPRYLFTGTATRLSFVTIEPPYPTPEGPYFVDYSVTRMDGRAELIRARAPFSRNMKAFPGATPANRVSLMEGRVAYRFSYGAKTEKGLVWHPHWPSQTHLPHLIRLEITDAQSGHAAAPSLIARVRADAELECLNEGQSLCSANPQRELIVKFDANPNVYRTAD